MESDHAGYVLSRMDKRGADLEHSRLVNHAVRMVSVQARVPLDYARTLMRKTAEATDTTVDEVAEEVVSGRARFDEP